MKQFRSYPIHVSGNTLTEKEISGEKLRRLQAYDNELKNNPAFRAEIEREKQKYGYKHDHRRELIKDYGYDINIKEPYSEEKHRFLEAQRMEDKPSSTAVKFETIIISQLETIYNTAIGKLFFDSFNQKKKLWITLLEGKQQIDCQCFAQTDDAPEKNHIEIKYPMPVTSSNSRWFRSKGEDILFHEIIHAHRRASGLDVFDYYVDQGEYISPEEFVATLFQNIYLACIGEQQFYRYSKIRLRVLPQKDYYEYLGSHVEIFKTLKYFLEKEPLSIKVARWAYPRFNPLRDYQIIKTIYYNNIRKR